MHQDDGFKGGSSFVRQLMERLLFAPALLQEGVADHAGWAFEARAEVEGDVRARLGAAATRQVDLKPAKPVYDMAQLNTGQSGKLTFGPSPQKFLDYCVSRAFCNLIYY